MLGIDRSGCYSPGAFDIHEEPERFIQVIAGYTMMDEEELGLDTFTEQDGDCRFVHIEQDGANSRGRLRMPLPINGQLSAAAHLAISQRVREMTGTMSPSFHGHPTGEGQRQTSLSWPAPEESRALPC
jgi:Fungal protein kinase